MYINDKCYCSRCLKEIEPGKICNFCGFDADEYREPDYALPLDAFLNERYQVGCVIGTGGFGITYAGWDVVLNKPIAIKEFFPGDRVERDSEITFSVIPKEDEEECQVYHKGKEWFQREARILAALGDTPNIVHVEDCFAENGTSYIIMDFIRGKSLADYLEEKGGRLSVKEALSLMKKPIEALTKVHQFGLLHRDISTRNLMIDEKGEVYLIDFGAATSLDSQSNLKTSEYFKNKSFSAPEQESEEEQGTWTDIYSVCAAMVCLMTGNKIPTVEERRKNDMVPAMLKRVKLSFMQRKALLHGLQLDVKQRTPNAHCLLNELYRVPLPKSEEEQRKQKRKAKILIVLFVITYMFIFIVGVLQLHEHIPQVVKIVSTQSVDEAMKLAEEYAQGWHFMNKTGAQYWYRWIVEHGTEEQICQVADIYFENDYEFLPKDKEYAIRLWEECRKRNYPGAYNALGWQYWSGEILEQDNAKAKEYFERGRELGNTDCMVNLAYFYIREEKEYKKAFNLFSEAAELGNCNGMYRLALMYDEGLGTEKNKQLALQWMMKASEWGQPDAMASIGYFYLTNELLHEDGTKWKDYRSGLGWLVEASLAGSANADLYFALIYLGEIDILDYVYASSYEVNDEAAFNCMLSAAEKNNSYAMMRVAKMYEEGFGTEVNLELAKEWSEKAQKYK